MDRVRFCASLLLLPVLTVAKDSPSFRGDPNHPGVYDEAPVTKFTQLKWRFQTKGIVVSSPALVGDTVYIGSADHRLYAINAATGTQKWTFKTESGVASSPAVSGGIVYFLSYDGNLYAVDAAAGTLKWKFATGGEHRFSAKHLHGSQPAAETMPDPFDVYLSSPLVSQGSVYFGSGDGNIYSLEAASGKLNWKFHTGDVVHASPVIANGTLYIGSWDSYFYALDAATGKEKWRFKTGEDPEIHNQVGIQSSAVVSEGIVYFGCRDSNLYALDAATGERKWAYNNKGSWVIASPVVSDGKLFFATSDSGMFRAVDAKSGQELFSIKFSGWPTFSSPAIAKGMLYVGSHSGKLFAIDLANQKQAWEFTTEGAEKNGAAYTNADGTPNYAAAYAGDFYDDMIVGVRKLMTVGGIYSSPVLADKVLYFGGTDGYVYAIM
jgi:eukaryotic-like serine/threonine-protein kinase